MSKHTLGLVKKLVIAKAILVVLNELVTLVANVLNLLHIVLNYFLSGRICKNGYVEK